MSQVKPSHLLLTCLCTAGVIFGIYYAPEIVTWWTEETRAAQNDLQVAQGLLKEGKTLDALRLIKTKKELMETEGPEGQAWFDLFLTASEKAPDPAQLLILYLYRPESFKNHENAALIVAPQLIGDGNEEGYESLRSLFEDASSPEWLVLDADYLVLQGKEAQAAFLLNAHPADGKQDIPRLVRLALLNINEHPRVAWNYLEQAEKKIPTTLTSIFTGQAF